MKLVKLSAIFLVLVALVMGQPGLALAQVTANQTPKTETQEKPDRVLKEKIKNPHKRSRSEVPQYSASTSPSTQAPLAPAATSEPTLSPVSQRALVAAPQAGPNLINNPSFQSRDTNGQPIGWHKGGYGTNDRVLNFPVAGRTDSTAASVAINGYTSGDAKWYFDDVKVTPGQEYTFSDYYTSDTTSIVTLQYTMADGSMRYIDIGTAIPSSNFRQFTTNFVVPTNVVSVTVFHLINQAGHLTTDDYSLTTVGTQPPPPPPPDNTNLVPNPGFEATNNNGLPNGWDKGSWGSNSPVFSYPVNGVNGTKATQVTLNSRTSGDAKWFFNPITLSPGTYTYSDQFMSNTTTYLTVQFQNADGTYSWEDIGTVPPASSFTNVSANFTVPAGVQNVTVFHLINQVGSLTLDNVAVRAATSTPPPPPPPPANKSVFDTGAVTLRFDDGWLSQYQNAVPTMNAAGLKGTFYIVTHQLQDYGYTGFMSKSQIANLSAMGDEIGAHTRTHTDLTTLSSSGQQAEIAGSRQDLLAMNVGPVSSFAYPYGAYDSTSIQLVQNAGFSSAAATIDGNVTPGSDRDQLERQSVLVNVPFSQVKSWIDNAIANKQWLILSFHEVNNSGNLYSTSPAVFKQIVNYLAQQHIRVVTVSEGAQYLP